MISKSEALIFGITLFIIALVMAWFLDWRIVIIDINLVLINILYSVKPFRLKDKKYWDIFFPAINFPKSWRWMVSFRTI